MFDISEEEVIARIPASYDDGEKAAFLHGFNDAMSIVKEALQMAMVAMQGVDMDEEDEDPELEHTPQDTGSQADAGSEAFNAGIHTKEG